MKQEDSSALKGFSPAAVVSETRADGSIVLRCPRALGPYARCIEEDLDIEYKYSRAGRRASGPTAERFNKIKDAASEAMSAVSDLEDAFEKE